ncbi:hypothetical protein [Novosphingobium sp.]|uniref:hypothetical protein n=1 Tax=Novosphingobium sp. TaxID=1874826 RepID=UPI002626D150|nr:hypothetical protein [Novosphingobium sp.]
MAKSLLDKLGWKAGTPAEVRDLPPALAEPLAPLAAATTGDPRFRIGFVRNAAELAEAIAALAPDYAPGGHLWLCYPKKSGAIRTDLTRDRGWEAVLARGFLPVSQIALDGDWSALRFRLRGEIPRLTRKGGTG